MEKVDEHGFLFGVEVGADRQCLLVGAIGVERDLLRAFRWFKAARVMFGLWSLSSKGLELRGEFGRVLDGLLLMQKLDLQTQRANT